MDRFAGRFVLEAEVAAGGSGIVYRAGQTYTVGYCHRRAAIRVFRLDRIEAAEPTEESFRPRRVSLLRDYVATLG